MERGPASSEEAEVGRGVLHTVGHSTRSAEELLELLAEHGIEVLVDVRRFPVSRRHPQFTREALAARLARSGIEYRHEVDLGGMREPGAGSPNTTLRNAAFRGYADHLRTSAFREALGRVLALARSRRVAVMCAEADPARCHRRILSDQAVALGVRVRHVLARGMAEDHALDPAARIAADGALTYGDAEPTLFS